MKKTRDFSEVIRLQLENDPQLAAEVEKEEIHAYIAQEIYNARQSLGMSQQQLAEKVGTRQSVIARMENADYSGHSLNTLQKIAAALNCNLRVEFYCKPKITQETSFTMETEQPAEWKPVIVTKGISTRELADI